MKNQIVFEVLERDPYFPGVVTAMEIGEDVPTVEGINGGVQIHAGRFSLSLTTQAAEDVRVQLALILDKDAQS